MFNAIKRIFHKLHSNKTVDFQGEKIFVLGNQKSGTSAISSLLAIALGYDPPKDIPYFWGKFQSEGSSGEFGLANAITKSSEAFGKYVIKEPCLTHYGFELASLFPNSSFIGVVRNPVENVRSIRDRLGLTSEQLVERHPSTKAIPDSWLWYLGFSREGIGADHSLLSRMIWRWNACADVLIDFPQHIEIVRYEDFCSDKKTTIDILARRLAVLPTQDISRYLNRQFQPKGEGSPLPSGLADTVRAECETKLKAFGYA